MTALYIILAVVAVIMLLLLIPADCILEFSYNNKENNGSVIIKYAFLKFKIFPNDKVEEVENEEETTDKEEKQEKSDILGIITLIKEVYKQLKKDILNLLDYIICHAIKIKELNVSSKFGMGNPMYTGIATGAVNAGVYLSLIHISAVCAEGFTTITNAAREPEIVDLGNFLNCMGAKVRGMGGSVIKIEGAVSYTHLN